MSIRVNDFRWIPGKNDSEYIKLLESSRDDWERIAKKAISKLKTLSKVQEAIIEPKRIDLADETKAWLDKMDAVEALENIADICIDWDGYRTADGLGELINEIWAYARYCADRIAKKQEPVAVHVFTVVDNCKIGDCPNCGRFISNYDDPKYCGNCGRKVKWDD